MPSQYQKKQYNNIFSKLPMAIKDVIASSESAEKVYNIAKKHHLQVDQAGILNEITVDVLMGITSARDFLENLKKDIEIDPNEAIGITNEINDELFKPIREIIEKTFNGGAPNKLRTISTVEENDDEHLHLTKHDILREIENPPEAVAVVTPSEQIITIKDKEIPEISKTTEIEEYNQELTGNKIEMKLVDSSLEIGDSKKDKILKEISAQPQPPKNIAEKQPEPVLKSITEMKLSGVTNIEKTKEIIKEVKKDEKPKPTIDPYREPIG